MFSLIYYPPRLLIFNMNNKNNQPKKNASLV